MFKIGSQVRLIANLPLGFGRNNEIAGINEQSKEFQGKVVTIDSIVLGGTQTPMYYEIKEDNGAGQWTPQMIQQIVTPSNAEDKYSIYVKENDGNVDKHSVDFVGDNDDGTKAYAVKLNGKYKFLEDSEKATGADVAKFKEDIKLIKEFEDLREQRAKLDQAIALVEEKLRAKGYID